MGPTAYYAIITVRATSSRLPEKCFLEFGGVTVLEHVMLRARHFGFEPVVSTSTNPSDERIVHIAKRCECLCFRGSEKDKLRRWADTCVAFGIERFHTIDGDDPFFDGELGRQSLELLIKGGYDMVSPSKKTYYGSVGYSLTADILYRACATKQTEDTEMMWYIVESLPGLRSVELPVNSALFRDVRLTLDYEEDYWLLRTVLRILGPYANRHEIENLFHQNAGLRLVNWFRNEEWRQGQLRKRPVGT